MVVEREPGLAVNLLEGAAGQVYAARFALGLDTRGNVDAVAENVVSVDDDVADIDADAERDPGLIFVVLRHQSLHRHGAGHGIHRAGKIDQQTISGGLDDASLMVGYSGIDDVAANPL